MLSLVGLMVDFAEKKKMGKETLEGGSRLVRRTAREVFDRTKGWVPNTKRILG